jgi:hypothetical protein
LNLGSKHFRYPYKRYKTYKCILEIPVKFRTSAREKILRRGEVGGQSRFQSFEKEEMLRSCNRAVIAVRSPEWEVTL